MNGLNGMQKQLEQMRMQMPLQPVSNIMWASGLEGVKGQTMANNSKLIVLDSENEGAMYIVTTDDVGMKKIRQFRYEEVEVKRPGQIDMTQYATKDDVRNIILEMFGEKGDSHDKAVQGTRVDASVV